jgi:hypothetical protein
MSIRWSSLIATLDGEIDQSKLKSLTAIALAWIGGLVLSAVMTGILKVPTDIVMIGVGALVLPLTGGKIAEGIANRVSPTPSSSNGGSAG